MPIITFWSNNEKAIGQTVAVSCAATVMAMDHNYKVLLVSADFNNDSIESCFGAQESNKELIKTLIKTPKINLDSGINGLLKMADSNRVTPELIHDYTKIVFKNRLEILYSPMDIQEDKKEKIMDNLKNIITNAARYYDYVFVDLEKGLKYVQQLEILEMSDVIVENIEQGNKSIEKFLTTNETSKFLNKNNVIWNICRYDKNSKYNTKNLTRTILKKQSVYETAYNTLISDAVQEGNIVEILIRFKTLKGEDDNSLFVEKIKELIEGIILKYKETRMRI